MRTGLTPSHLLNPAPDIDNLPLEIISKGDLTWYCLLRLWLSLTACELGRGPLPSVGAPQVRARAQDSSIDCS